MYDSSRTSTHITPRILEDLPGITAGFSFRTGGASEGPYASLNLGLSTDDDAARVHENRRRLFEPLGISVDRLVIAGQVHGRDVHVANEPGLFPGFDALVTTDRDLTLCITSADCAVILLADEFAGVVGACHSGWRGTVADVAGATVRKMTEIGAVGHRVRAYVSPCISVDHFEVGDEVAARFSQDYVARRTDWLKPHVDLRSAIGGQLVRAGLRGDAIEISPHCTFAETDTFFSYRAEDGTTGRMMGFVRLDP